MGTFIRKHFLFHCYKYLKNSKHFIALFKISFQKPNKEHVGIHGPPNGGLAMFIIASKPAFINDECMRTQGSRSYGSVH